MSVGKYVQIVSFSKYSWKEGGVRGPKYCSLPTRRLPLGKTAKKQLWGLVSKPEITPLNCFKDEAA